jgi:hypothetical protein
MKYVCMLPMDGLCGDNHTLVKGNSLERACGRRLFFFVFMILTCNVAVYAPVVGNYRGIDFWLNIRYDSSVPIQVRRLSYYVI